MSFVGADKDRCLYLKQPCPTSQHPKSRRQLELLSYIVVFNGILEECDHGIFHHHCLRLARFACASGRGGSDALQRPVELALSRHSPQGVESSNRSLCATIQERPDVQFLSRHRAVASCHEVLQLRIGSDGVDKRGLVSLRDTILCRTSADHSATMASLRSPRGLRTHT